MAHPNLNYRARRPGELLEVKLTEKGLYWEIGPDVWPARGHQGAGGTFSLAEFEKMVETFPEYPELFVRIRADLKEFNLLPED